MEPKYNLQVGSLTHKLTLGTDLALSKTRSNVRSRGEYESSNVSNSPSKKSIQRLIAFQMKEDEIRENRQKSEISFRDEPRSADVSNMRNLNTCLPRLGGMGLSKRIKTQV